MRSNLAMVGLPIVAVASAAGCGGKRDTSNRDTGSGDIACEIQNDSRIGLATGNTTTDAVNGKGSFTSPQKVPALARIYDNYTQVVVRADAGINSRNAST